MAYERGQTVLTLPDVALMILGSLAPMITRPVWNHVQVLETGVLRTLGLAGGGDILQIPPGVEPGALVGIAWGGNTVRAAGRVGRPPGPSADRFGGRNRGAAERREDQGQGGPPGRGAFDAKRSGGVLRAEIDLPDGAGVAALEPAPVDAAVPDPACPVGAGDRAHPGWRRSLCLRRP